MGCCSSGNLVAEDRERQMHEAATAMCNIQPSHFVLQVGFAHGHGLREALRLIRGGQGRVLGTETSQVLMSHVGRGLGEELQQGTLELGLYHPSSTPFIHNMFDVVFTVNDFLYWHDINATLKEVYRVMRPGCLFLTCLYQEPMVSKADRERQVHAHIDTKQYADSLTENGFVKVKIQEHRNAKSGFKYQTIYAYSRQRK
ncbi:hypothetical protein DPMN_009228 [Dreissena polymorpha]|uniref:Methyltransferase domain-containing protein n=1 Tax=Dreissena polymorpha TaxID=45954 RepID=A0A9D4MZW0_DREPO|nr:hypothetical protein DPMN_009228 [Dreissena polymorpha]